MNAKLDIHESIPHLLDDHSGLGFTAHKCNLGHWIEHVAQDTLMGLTCGHKSNLHVPSRMLEGGPLREAMIEEFAYRALTEEMATRTLSTLIAIAPSLNEMEFVITLVADEARHAAVFRGHLVELGISEAAVQNNLEQFAGNTHKALLPVEDFALKVMRDEKSFLGGIAINTILVEGLLAPASELSDRKWRLLDPVASDIEHRTGIDEIRHLSVGAAIVKEHLESDPTKKEMLFDLIKEGMAVWSNIELSAETLRREQLFQQGMLEHKTLLEGYEIAPDIRLLDTTPEQRMELAQQWSRETQAVRLKFMGIPNALDF